MYTIFINLSIALENIGMNKYTCVYLFRQYLMFCYNCVYKFAVGCFLAAQ